MSCSLQHAHHRYTIHTLVILTVQQQVFKKKAAFKILIFFICYAAGDVLLLVPRSFLCRRCVPWILLINEQSDRHKHQTTIPILNNYYSITYGCFILQASYF